MLEDIFVLGRFSEARLLVNGRTVSELSGAEITVFKVNNMNKCATRTLTEDKINRLSLVSSSGIYLAGVGQRVFTAEGAMNGCGISITRRELGSVGPSVVVGGRRAFCAPRASRGFSFSGCSCMISTVSAMANGVRLIVRTSGTGAPVVYSVKTNGGLSPATFRITSVCGASIYPLTEIVERRLGEENVGGLGIICSGRGPVAPISSVTVDYGAGYVYPPKAREGYARHERIPNDATFIPSITNLVVTNRIVGSLVGWVWFLAARDAREGCPQYFTYFCEVFCD